MAEEPEAPEEQVEEHLRDSVAGSLKLKRFLEDADASGAKRQKGSGQDQALEAQIQKTLIRWQLTQDAATRYALRQLSQEEFKQLEAAKFWPDPNHQWLTPCQLVRRHVLKLREQNGPGGGALDSVSAFRHRWGLEMKDDKFLRSLCHKDLRHVICSYDATVSIEDLATESQEIEVELGMTSGTVPEAAGPLALGRFLRLEMIDPLADALICGDANLTFSLKLARHRKALGHCGRVVATTFEQLDTLKERYEEVPQTISELEEHFAEVWHGVDATRLAVDSRFHGHEDSFGAVYYNFPHAGAVRGFYDCHPLVNWRHENLMRLFFRALRSFMKPSGSVKVASNSGAVGVRYSYIISSATENEFVHVETVPFQEWQLHRYLRSYGDKRDAHKRVTEAGTGYNAQKAASDMVYSFCYAPSGQPLAEQQIQFPPTKADLQAAQEGPLKGPPASASRTKLVDELYNRFKSEVQGVHVG